MTTANRLWRLYVTKNNREIELKLLINFIVSVYGPSLFEIKQQWSCTHESKHYLNQIKRIEKLPEGTKKTKCLLGLFKCPCCNVVRSISDIRNIAVKKIMNCHLQIIKFRAENSI